MALTDQQLEYISEAMIPLFQYLEKEVITDICQRIEHTLAYTRTAELQAISMRELGYSPAKIRSECVKIIRADEKLRKIIAKNTLEHKRATRKIMNDLMKEAYKANDEVILHAGQQAWINDLQVWKDAGKELTDNSYLKDLTDSMTAQTAGELKNLTQTTGFKTMSGYESLETAYRKELDKAMIKICSGTFSRDKVVEETIHSLSKSGLRSIDFASGYSMQLDTAVRLAIRTGCHQMAAKVTDRNILATGENLVYVSKHWGARNKGTGHENHEQWQGRVYFIKEGKDYHEEAKRVGQDYITSLWYATGYSVDGSRENDPLGLNGYNCRHNYYVHFEGVSSLPDESPEPKPVKVNGREYDYYAITQKMRGMERDIRALKREREAQKKLGMETKDIERKIDHKTAEYKDFCKDCKVKEKSERLRYECGTSDLKKTKAWNGFEVSVLESKERLTWNNSGSTMNDKEDITVNIVGKIDKEIYKCITDNIVTDEVIITDERIQHIKDRHPNDYERYYGYLKEIIENPQYIVETNKPYTALILKEFTDGEEQFKTVLRLITSHDNPDYKNSIITFMKINDKEWRRLLKNKRILYKNE